jgi:aminocarboxymuconate-semialdehyde decarboxylase
VTAVPAVLPGSGFRSGMGTEDPLGALRAAALTESDYHPIRGGNAADLPGLSRARAEEPR